MGMGEVATGLSYLAENNCDKFPYDIVMVFQTSFSLQVLMFYCLFAILASVL